MDFDIEGAAELDQHSLHLRDLAIVGLQAANPDLEGTVHRARVPGPRPRRLRAQRAADREERRRARIDVVNAKMAMDYGQDVDNRSDGPGRDLGGGRDRAAVLTDMGLVAKIGVTPMTASTISPRKFFTPTDAEVPGRLRQDRTSQLALLSMWSVARDNGGGDGSRSAAPDNSGVAQQRYQYAGIPAPVRPSRLRSPNRFQGELAPPSLQSYHALSRGELRSWCVRFASLWLLTREFSGSAIGRVGGRAACHGYRPGQQRRRARPDRRVLRPLQPAGRPHQVGVRHQARQRGHRNPAATLQDRAERAVCREVAPACRRLHPGLDGRERSTASSSPSGKSPSSPTAGSRSAVGDRRGIERRQAIEPRFLHQRHHRSAEPPRRIDHCHAARDARRQGDVDGRL